MAQLHSACRADYTGPWGSVIHSAVGLPQADFTLVVAQSRPTTPEKEWRAETFFSAFCQNFATWLSLITIK